MSSNLQNWRWIMEIKLLWTRTFETKFPSVCHLGLTKWETKAACVILNYDSVYTLAWRGWYVDVFFCGSSWNWMFSCQNLGLCLLAFHWKQIRTSNSSCATRSNPVIIKKSECYPNLIHVNVVQQRKYFVCKKHFHIWHSSYKFTKLVRDHGQKESAQS